MKSFIVSVLLLLTEISIYSQQSSVSRLNFDEFVHYLEKRNDSVYVINFWATWCGPCRQEMPDLEQISRNYAGHKVKILLVSLDLPSMLEKSLIPYIRDHNISSQVVLLDDPDANSWIDKIDPSWSGGIPATLVYSKTNRIFYGEKINYDIIDHTLRELLNQLN